VTRGVLYVVRDPRDVALSLAAFFSIEVDHAIARMGDPACEIGSRPGSTQCRQRLSTWSGHVTSWLEAPVPRCVVRYEDLLTDPALSLERMAGFLGWPVTPSSIDAAVEATSFDVLRAQERRDGFREGVRQRAIPFFRSGTAGGWRTSLLPAQLARIEQDHGETMRRLGYIAG
jgi:hypothetical protein